MVITRHENVLDRVYISGVARGGGDGGGPPDWSYT